MRATGQGFSYNTGRAVGSLVPMVVGVLAADLGLGVAMGLCAACAYMLVLIATSMLPETRGQELETGIEPHAAAAFAATWRHPSRPSAPSNVRSYVVSGLAGPVCDGTDISPAKAGHYASTVDQA